MPRVWPRIRASIMPYRAAAGDCYFGQLLFRIAAVFGRLMFGAPAIPGIRCRRLPPSAASMVPGAPACVRCGVRASLCALDACGAPHCGLWARCLRTPSTAASAPHAVRRCHYAASRRLQCLAAVPASTHWTPPEHGEAGGAAGAMLAGCWGERCESSKDGDSRTTGRYGRRSEIWRDEGCC
jgi:hypothetical protein